MLMYGLRRQTCSTSFVVCGMIFSPGRKSRMVQVLTHQRSPQISSDISGRTTSRYMKARTLHRSTLLPTITPSIPFLAPRILYAAFRITVMHPPRSRLPRMHPLLLHYIQSLRTQSRAQQEMPMTPPTCRPRSKLPMISLHPSWYVRHHPHWQSRVHPLCSNLSFSSRSNSILSRSLSRVYAHPSFFSSFTVL
ncbi:hypothetical protein EI94DRAFT_933448 [Lactarius quietus]|nr:hypothetical protein EI94DRAFT_933448 [Lactarius quietus]